MARKIDINNANFSDFEQYHMDTAEIPYRIITAEDVNANGDYEQDRIAEFLTAFYKARERKRGLRDLACYAREVAGLLYLDKIYIADKTNPWIAVARIKMTTYLGTGTQTDYVMESYAIEAGNWDRYTGSSQTIRSKHAKAIINAIEKVGQQVKPAVVRAALGWGAGQCTRQVLAENNAVNPIVIFDRAFKYSDRPTPPAINLFRILDRLHKTQGLCSYEDLKLLMPEATKMFEEAKESAREAQDFHNTLADKGIVNIVKLSDDHRVYFKVNDDLYSINNPELTPIEVQTTVATLESIFPNDTSGGNVNRYHDEWQAVQGVGAKRLNTNKLKTIDNAYVTLVSNECAEQIKQIGERIEE